MVCDTCIRELIVLDIPPQVCLNINELLKKLFAIIVFFLFQKRFPIDSLAEWNNGHPLGLRTVNAYILVFDMGNLDSFQVCNNTS